MACGSGRRSSTADSLGRCLVVRYYGADRQTVRVTHDARCGGGCRSSTIDSGPVDAILNGAATVSSGAARADDRRPGPVRPWPFGGDV